MISMFLKTYKFRLFVKEKEFVVLSFPISTQDSLRGKTWIQIALKLKKRNKFIVFY